MNEDGGDGCCFLVRPEVHLLLLGHYGVWFFFRSTARLYTELLVRHLLFLLGVI